MTYINKNSYPEDWKELQQHPKEQFPLEFNNWIQNYPPIHTMTIINASTKRIIKLNKSDIPDGVKDYLFNPIDKRLDGATVHHKTFDELKLKFGG